VLVATVLVGIVAPTTGHAAKLLVANDGVDAAGCGVKNAPCRTIGFALTLATAGDTVIVGPGQYGDLDGDGLLTRTDEEQLGTSACTVNVDKAVTLLSSAGAGATVIHSGGSMRSVLCVVAPGAVIGKRKKGFTFTGAGGTSTGVFVDLASAETGAVVAGNRMVGNGFGITAFGQNVLRGNHVVGNTSVGVYVTGNVVMEGSLVSANGDDGILVVAGFALLRNLVVSANGDDGIQISDPTTVERTIVTANGRAGINVAEPNATIVASALVGNARAGLEVLEDAGAFITKSNIVGNGPEIAGANPANCGVLSGTSFPVAATPVWWGAPTGPGGQPADLACTTAGPIIVEPLATKPVKVSPKLQSPE
jgi:hypothetical protein